MSVKSSSNPRNTMGLAGYPSSGAYAHLPFRTTITGDAMVPHPNANKIFLRNLPGHCYTLPDVPLNFTVVEMIVFLPNWFKNRAIATRFMNNYLTAAVHFEIFEEHRKCKFEDDHEREKAKKTIADEYRKTMRSYPHNRGWTKAKHEVQPGWDHMVVSMNGFVPDDSRLVQYRRLPSVPLRDLMIGVRKLPEGANAGDLTRCVQFALRRPEDFTFPDDLPQILEHVGRTQITNAHTDRPIIQAYADHMRISAAANRPKPDRKSRPSAQERAAREKADGETHKMAEQIQMQRTTSKAVQQPPLRVTMTAPDGHTEHQSQFTMGQSGEETDDLLRSHIQENFQAPTYPTNLSAPYHPRRLLRECIEGHVAFDGSPIARAARFAQQHDQIDTQWFVENVPFLVQLLDSVPLIERAF